MTVSMYSRRACHLCDDARATILAVQQRIAFRFDERFIDGRDELERDYGLRVPVVEVNGIEEFEYVVDPSRLEGLVRGV